MTASTAVLRVAALDLRDLARQRGTWLSLLMFPIVNVVLITVLPGVLSEREQARSETATYTVAVEGDEDDTAAVGALLAGQRLEVVPAPDATRSVRARDSHVGVVVADGAAAAIAGDGRATVRVVALGTRQASRAAAARVVATLEATAAAIARERVEAAALPIAAAVPLDATFVDLAGTERGARLELSNVVPAILLLPLSGAVGLAGQRVSGGKDQRVLEPLLVLPISRASLLAGKAVAGYVLGCVTLPAVVLPLLLGRLIPIGSAGRRIELAPTTVLATLAVAALLLAFLVAVGACAGAASRSSSEMASLLPFTAFPMLILAIVLPFFDLQSSVPWALVPVLGPLLLGRDLVAGAVPASAAAVAVLSTLAWSTALVGGASRFLERERSVLRATT